MKGNPYMAFVPWIIFGLVSRADKVATAAIAALIASVLVALPAVRRRSPKLLEMATIVTFVCFTVVALASDPGPNSVLERYARAIAAGALCVIALVSLLVTPFTEQYAKEIVPREYWTTPLFKRTNVVFTALWALAFAGIALSHTIAGAINTRRAETIFNWIVPIVVIVAVLRFMERYRERTEVEPSAQQADQPI